MKEPKLSYDELVRLNSHLEKRVKLLEEKVIQLKDQREDQRENESLFRQLADITTEGVIIHDNGAIQEANRHIAEMLNCSSGSLIGRNILDFIDIGFRKDTIKSIRNNSPVRFDTVLHREDGTVKETEMATYPFTYRNRDLQVSIFRDLTHQKRMETAFEESNLMFRQLVENSTDAIIIQNEYVVLYWNHAVERILGVRGIEIHHKPDFLIDYIHPEDRSTFLEIIQSEKFNKEHRFDIKFRVVRPDGQVVWVWNRCFPVFNCR